MVTREFNFTLIIGRDDLEHIRIYLQGTACTYFSSSKCFESHFLGENGDRKSGNEAMFFVKVQEIRKYKN